MRNKKHSISWLTRMLVAFVCFVGGFEWARTSWGEPGGLALLAALVSALGLSGLLFTEWQARPGRALRRARRAIHFPTQWAVRFDKTLPQGGVIPVAVIRSDGVRFVIDIQRFSHVEWQRQPADAAAPALVGPNGKVFKHDPVGPLVHAAQGWGATAILWLPEARSVRNLRQDDGRLIVVMGGARELNHVLRGAEIVPQGDASLEMTQPPQRLRAALSANPNVSAVTVTPMNGVIANEPAELLT